MKQYLRYGIILLLVIILTLFLLMIVKENARDYTVIIFFASIIILVLYAFLKLRKVLHHHKTEFESYKLAIFVPVGALSSYFINHELGLGPVLGASIVGLLASFIPNFNKQSIYLQGLPTAIYCGAFIGMSHLKIADGYAFVLTASFFTGIFLMVSKSILQGVGGKLGALAFLGVVVTYFLLMLVK